MSLDVRLRPVERSDLDRLFEIQLDPEGCRMAAVRPRTRQAFDALWDGAQGLTVAARAILADGELTGSMSCFVASEGGGPVHAVGYAIERAFWGKGIATRALGLFLEEVRTRPLYASVARHNVASIRVLERNGFELVRYEHGPETERYLECEVGVFRLA